MAVVAEIKERKGKDSDRKKEYQYSYQLRRQKDYHQRLLRQSNTKKRIPSALLRRIED